MEEVDKIIIQSLSSLGCEFNPEVTSVGQFDQDLVIESVARLLNAINGESAEQFPTKLPPNTGVKFRICSKFASNCQQLGYKHEIGYQTFLYSNEIETRRLISFLLEKLSKDVNIFAANVDGQQDAGGGASAKRGNKMKQVVAATVKELLAEFWTPPFIKPNGVKFDKDSEFVHEGARGMLGFNTNVLSIPSAKAKYTKEQTKYYESYCKLVPRQSRTHAVDFMASLIELNAIERAKENAMFKTDFNAGSNSEAKKAEYKAHMNELRNALRKAMNKKENKDRPDMITDADLAEIEASLQGSGRIPLIKGSRFTHAQDLQFTSNDAGKAVSLVENPTEKEEEINRLREKLKSAESELQNVQVSIDELENTLAKLQEAYENQVKLNKELDDLVAIRRKTVNLINDVPANIIRLKDEIRDHEKRMNALKEKLDGVKEPLEKENEMLQQKLADKQLEYQRMMQETKDIRRQIETLNVELGEKEALAAELNQEMASQAKEMSRTTNRQFYTRRILEIVDTIDKQRKEIDKILIETRAVQKDINQLTGKLERLFNTTDETLFKDAKKDELTKKIYKLFININTSYEELLKTMENSSQVEREIIDLEDQVNTESQNKIVDNLEKALKDLTQIKEENDKLIAKIKASK